MPSDPASVTKVSGAAGGSGGAGLGAEIDPFELAIVLSHYDLGLIKSIGRVRKGANGHPKLVIRTESGRFLLKRRAVGDDERAQAFQRTQLHLASVGYPVPELIGTRRDSTSVQAQGARIYEMFKFIPGERYANDPEQARSAGYALALFHQHTQSLPACPAGVSFHANTAAVRVIQNLPLKGDLRETLTATYQEAAAQAEATGLAGWPKTLIHGDWHPGNLIFHEHGVAAVLDLDGMRTALRIEDIASAALHFSMVAPVGTPTDEWPAELDRDRLRALLEGYDALAEQAGMQGLGMLSTAELQALPYLMAQALICEGLGPLAAGSGLRDVSAEAVLRMAVRKAVWLVENAQSLSAGLDS